MVLVMLADIIVSSKGLRRAERNDGFYIFFLNLKLNKKLLFPVFFSSKPVTAVLSWPSLVVVGKRGKEEDTWSRIRNIVITV